MFLAVYLVHTPRISGDCEFDSHPRASGLHVNQQLTLIGAQMG